MTRYPSFLALCTFVWLFLVAPPAQEFAFAAESDFEARVTHGYATNNGVKIHYTSLGQGPLIVMIHGFPDYWFTWRNQMEALSKSFRTVAIDLRGYNLSDKPKGVESYD